MSKSAAAQTKKEEGNQLFKSKEYFQAIEKYTEAIKLDPTDVTFYSNRSACYAAVNMWAKAAADGRKCIKTDKSFVKGYFRTALALQALGNKKEALDAVKRGLDVDPTCADLKTMADELNEAIEKKGKHRKAQPVKAMENLDIEQGSDKSALLQVDGHPRLKQYGGMLVALGFEVVAVNGLVGYYHDLNPQPKCCSHQDASLVFLGVIPVMAIVVSVVAYLMGLVASCVDPENPLTSFKFCKTCTSIVGAALTLATVIGAAIVYGLTLNSAVQVLVGSLGGFFWSIVEYRAARKRSDEIASGAKVEIEGNTRPSTAKCAYCCSSCCSLYVLITLTISLLVMAGQHNQEEFCLNNYSKEWTSCSCDSLNYYMYTPSRYGPIDYYNVTEVEQGGYGTVFEYCHNSTFYCCTWEPEN